MSHSNPPSPKRFSGLGPLTGRIRVPGDKSISHRSIMLGALAGFDARDPGSVDTPVPDYTDGIDGGIKGLRVGVPENFFFDALDPEVETIVRAAISQLESEGARLVPVTLPLIEHYLAVEFGLCLPEASAYHQDMLRERADRYEDDVRTFLEIGEVIPATTYIKALRVRERIKSGWREMFDSIDVLAAPTVPATAAKVGQENFTWRDGGEESSTSAYVRHSCPANLTGLPSITVPCGFSGDGLPVGMQILGRPFDEATVLRAAKAYESATDWRARSPDL